MEIYYDDAADIYLVGLKWDHGFGRFSSTQNGTAPLYRREWIMLIGDKQDEK